MILFQPGLKIEAEWYDRILRDILKSLEYKFYGFWTVFINIGTVNLNLYFFSMSLISHSYI